MKNNSHKKVCLYREVHIRVDPHPNTQLKSNLYMDSEKGYVDIKLCRNPMSEKSDMYEFIMALFDNG